MNILKMTLKLWGSGITALMVMAVSMMPLSLINQDNVAQVMLRYMLIGFVVAPIMGGAAQHWFWKDHDWLGVSK